eukprot:CAMPEP_0206317732 /NCGR_PEP_ID=MMETSP0106_2-20121207/16789_1 /ASSEMBLY_ACC=CAM_ASM_000206 /TAXON_ID=81532 /ORGANISM="Acanthoeca-like sp., Strain 10tr" /LENGTH=117 /DNA_ID=CAMNT_0053749337 /DNA_START=126 /DNA_END=479 /DNA_ORIENTATION=+
MEVATFTKRPVNRAAESRRRHQRQTNRKGHWPAWPASVAEFCAVSFWLGMSDEEVAERLDHGFRASSDNRPPSTAPSPESSDERRSSSPPSNGTAGTRRRSIARILNPAFDPHQPLG